MGSLCWILSGNKSHFKKGIYSYCHPLGIPETPISGGGRSSPAPQIQGEIPKFRRERSRKVKNSLKKTFGRKIARSTRKHRGHSRRELIPAKPGLLPPGASPSLLPPRARFQVFPFHPADLPPWRGGGTDSGKALDSPREWGSTRDSRDRRGIPRENHPVSFLPVEFVAGRGEKGDVPMGILLLDWRITPDPFVSSLDADSGCLFQLGILSSVFSRFFPFLCKFRRNFWDSITFGMCFRRESGALDQEQFHRLGSGIGSCIHLFLQGAAPGFSREFGMCGEPAGKCCRSFIPIKYSRIQDKQGIIPRERYFIETSSHIQV